MGKYYSVLIFLLLAVPVTEPEAQSQNEIFTQFVGQEIIMEPDITAKVLKSSPGEKFFADTNSDGLIDVIYFIDTDEKHGDLRQPLLVKVIDEDGDMHLSREGDLDSDIYVADWYGDGTIDRIVDYNDLDGDNDVDEQYLYQWSDNKRLKKMMTKLNPEKAYLVAWVKDYGYDNRLWYHTNYEYGQRITQWKTDFNGDEMFVYVFFFDYSMNTLTPIWENAFSFYDLDDDSYSEEVVRFTGTGTVTNDLRYSMDIDNDNHGENVHDYDFSISCLGPIDIPPENCRRVQIRGHTTDPIIKWEDMRPVSKIGAWNKIHLTWDENDNNIDPVKGRMHNERWEGVLNHGNEYMQQVGGPSCGPYNKRNEVDMDASGTMRLYYSPVDKRLHLYGAEVGWIKVDYDYNETIDMNIRMDDSDGNGFFDTWKYDADGDSLFERTVKIEKDVAQIYLFDYFTLNKKYMSELNKIIRDNEQFIDVIKAVLRRCEKTFVPDKVEEYFRTSLVEYGKDFKLGEKILNSPEGRRYYQDLIKERYWQRLTQAPVAKDEFFREIKETYESGDIGTASGLLKKYALR